MSLLHRELQRENVWSRIHLVPLLLAEGDRDAYRRQQAALAREKEIMKDVKGWEVRRFISAWLSGMPRTVADEIRLPFLLSAMTVHDWLSRQERVCITIRGIDLRTALWCFDSLDCRTYVSRPTSRIDHLSAEESCDPGG